MKLTYQDLINKHEDLSIKIEKQTIEHEKAKAEKDADEIIITTSLLKNLKNQFESFKDISIIEEAFKLLESSKSLDYIISVINKVHLGDTSLCKVMILSFVSTIISNTSGIQPKLTGDSGKGKSHLAETVYFLLPDEYKDEGSLSAKSLFRAEHLKLGTVFFSDDIKMTDDLDSTLKRSMGNFQRPTIHNTLDKENKFIKVAIPARIVWWLTSVETDFSEELINRLDDNNVDESIELDKRVAKHTFTHDSNIDETHETLVCRTILAILKLHEFRVEIPFGENIEWNNPGDRRNPGRFKAYLQAFAALNYMNRTEKQDGVILASIEDYHSAKELYEIKVETQTTKLTKSELRLAKYMVDNNMDFLKSDDPQKTLKRIPKYLSINDIVANFPRENGKSYTYQAIRKIILGDQKGGKKGLLDKVPGMQILENGRETKYRIPSLDLPKGDVVSISEKISMLNECIRVEV